MKRLVFVMGLSAMLSTAWLSAQTSGNSVSQPVGQGRGAYVDANKNGVCDNYEVRQATVAGKRGQRNNPGGYGRGWGGSQRGKNFVDANKNGVCDNYENRMQQK
ncbi:MAG: hypothetical protein ACP5PZ_00540 [Bacteroidales bacterium]